MRPRPLALCSLFSALLAAQPPDLLITGAGVAGLSAALEAARAGLRVTIVERNSVPGGHAVISSGGVAIVGTPVQQKAGVKDTPELARQDFLRWGEDANEAWVRAYTENSRTDLYDWLTSLGTEFLAASLNGGGSSLPRFHIPRNQGLGLVIPLHRELLRHPNVTFLFNTLVTGIVTENGRVIGVSTRHLRTGESATLKAPAVLLSTGGFANNLDIVRASWPKSMPLPERVLVGGGFFANGDAMDLAKPALGASGRLDHQWNYATGLPDPFDPEGKRGHFASAASAIWVNAQGRRFVLEQHEPKITIPIVAAQKPARFWSIFDAEGRKNFRIVHAGYGDDRHNAVFNVPNFIHKANSLEELARLTGLPPAELKATVERYNSHIDAGADPDFHRFPSTSPLKPRKIAEPPFYAAPMFILIRKSLGGIQVDESCRVLTADGKPIPGLFAAGEATGFGGLHGKNGIEGAFLGGSIYMGRVAARTIAVGAKHTPVPPGDPLSLTPPAVKPADANTCKFCHNIPELTATPRPGYWHFERSHKLVTSRNLACTTCHAEMAPYADGKHKADAALRTNACFHCHTNPPRN